MKKYTVGFIFNRDLTKVLLVHKLAPEWQVGLINGVGGKVEEGEDNVFCMVREVREETGIETDSNDWVYIGLIRNEDKGVVATYGYIYDGELFEKYTYEKEELEWFSVNKLPPNVIHNLKWIIPLTLEKIREKKIISFDVNYSEF